MGNCKKGLLIVLSGPAGVGKSTLVDKLTAEFSTHITQSISCTTRKVRGGEIDGEDYLFLTEKTFKEREEGGDFLEVATVFGERYGTLRAEVEKERERGKHVVLVIDTQGALKVKKEGEGIFIFIMPPSFACLQKRLEGRQTESKTLRETRLKWAQFEMKQVKHYDYQLINDDLEAAYIVLKSIVIAEDHRLSARK